MLKQFNRFLLLALIVAMALYVTLTNSDSATIKLGPSITLTTYAGVIYIGVFALGCVAASLVALFFGFKGYLRERRLRAAERARQNFFKVFEEARNLMAGGDWAAARLQWEEIVRREPDNVVARVELSQCIEQLGDEREALRVLDATRASSKASAEVLYRAASLNRRIGNNTAARDNADLLLANKPSWRALELARDASESMQRFDDAIRYHDELEKFGYQSEDSNAIRARLEFERISQEVADEGALAQELAGLIKKYPRSDAAIQRLADIERKNGNIERASELLTKLAKSSAGSVERWREVVSLWLESTTGDTTRRTDRAIAAAKSASKDQRGRQRLEAELLTIRTLLAVNHFQDAERLLDGFSDLASREIGELPVDLNREFLIQRGYCLAQMGNARDTAGIWRSLALAGSAKAGEAPAKGALAERSEPSPALSTP